MGLSKSPLPWSSKGGFTSKHADFSPSAWTAGHIRSPTLKGRGEGFWGCLQMMAVIPAMSSSSSTAPAVNPGSPENTRLGHRARSRLRMVSRRTARVKGEDSRLNSRGQMGQDLGSPFPHTAHPRKGHHLCKTPRCQHTHSLPILPISEGDQREVPVLTQQEGASIDNLARFQSWGGADRVTQTL